MNSNDKISSGISDTPSDQEYSSRAQEEARSLLNATTDVVGEEVAQARKRLYAALDDFDAIRRRVRDKAVYGARVTDECVHEHPWQSMGIALGVGALIGLLLARRSS